MHFSLPCCLYHQHHNEFFGGDLIHSDIFFVWLGLLIKILSPAGIDHWPRYSTYYIFTKLISRGRGYQYLQIALGSTLPLPILSLHLMIITNLLFFKPPRLIHTLAGGKGGGEFLKSLEGRMGVWVDGWMDG